MEKTESIDFDRLKFENELLSAALRNLELQLFALYAERDADKNGELNTSYQDLLKSQPEVVS